MSEREQRAVRYLESVIKMFPGSIGPGARDELRKVCQILQGWNDCDAPEVGRSGAGPSPETTATKGEVATANGRIDELNNHVGNLERRLERIEAWAQAAPRNVEISAAEAARAAAKELGR